MSSLLLFVAHKMVPRPSQFSLPFLLVSGLVLPTRISLLGCSDSQERESSDPTQIRCLPLAQSMAQSMLYIVEHRRTC